MSALNALERAAQDVLTEKEHAAWVLAHRGMSQRAIAAWLNVDRSTVRDRLERAEGKLAKAEVEG